MIRLAILASGTGTNAENMIRYFSGHALITVGVVLSNNSNAPVLAKAARHQVPSKAYPRADWESPSRIISHLTDLQIDYLILAGFLLKVHPEIVSSWPGKILNIHPALLPKYGGKGMYGDNVHRAVLQSGDTESGITIHLVNEEYDEGRIIFQSTCPVLPDDNPPALANRVHDLEYRHYPKIVEHFIFPGQ